MRVLINYFTVWSKLGIQLGIVLKLQSTLELDIGFFKILPKALATLKATKYFQIKPHSMSYLAAHGL
jgi:hypothetical protein